MINIKTIQEDWSASAVIAGLIAVTISYAGPLVIVFQAAKMGQLSPAQLSSWIWAISIGSGVTGVFLSLRYRTPVITAWSTPGAALLITALTQYPYAEAIGAYLFSAVLITILGLTGLFSKLMERLPKGVIAAMLAGILFRFGVGVFASLEQLPALVLPMLLTYLVARRWLARYAIVATLLVGFAVALALQKISFQGFSATLATPLWTTPHFSLAAIIGLGIPLCFVTMASQNAPGIAVLRTAGYDTPINPLVSWTGLVSIVLAPFGAHGINLAAITAAICTGQESHARPERRYIAGLSCGAFYLLVGAFGATISSLFAALPPTLIAALAGLALFGSLATGLGTAMANDAEREPALITFLVTASGITFFGIGAAFWGLLAGVGANWLLFVAFKKIDLNKLLRRLPATSLNFMVDCVSKKCDYLVVGAGIAGASVAYELAEAGSVVLLERESMPGYHSTGRSAAIFLETYGNATIRALTHCSRAFFENPPPGFADTALISARGALFLATQEDLPALRAHYDTVSQLVDTVQWIDQADALAALLPCMASQRWVAGVYEPDAQDLDVNAIHQGFLRGYRQRKGELVVDAQVMGAHYAHGLWHVQTSNGQFAAPYLINAAGAWSDQLAQLAGLQPAGLAPLRRTAVIIDAPAGSDDWPYFGDIAESFYVKPDAGRLLASPCDESPMAPCDVLPDELDVAVIADRIENMTTLPVKRIVSKWAGLRTFAPDRSPVVGPTVSAEGFVWLAGQGGYGIQTAPAMARCCKALIIDKKIPHDLAALGVSAHGLSADRFRAAA